MPSQVVNSFDATWVAFLDSQNGGVIGWIKNINADCKDGGIRDGLHLVFAGDFSIERHNPAFRYRLCILTLLFLMHEAIPYPLSGDGLSSRAREVCCKAALNAHEVFSPADFIGIFETRGTSMRSRRTGNRVDPGHRYQPPFSLKRRKLRVFRRQLPRYEHFIVEQLSVIQAQLQEPPTIGNWTVVENRFQLRK
ncbi:hypothetical protein ARMGADRAFT_1025251 [Armillaria gallica]|uniref:Uncharacterized protein n=1 Tax=Armillaria gallica TaxID=47427 RepID=A0A2H3DUK6_ARMGA|nr:hypothetical protein ARMGADRAFT_1025251 [Armillaria gallica]